MRYIRVRFLCNPNTEMVKDILSALLADIGYDAFVEEDGAWAAYVPSEQYSSKAIDAILSDFPIDAHISYDTELMDNINWNEEWEKNYFRPISIDNQLCVYSSFHQPEGDYRYKIIIDPKMSFGTGHHETTKLMLEKILRVDMKDKRVLDMGCGTAVLAILASIRGASEVTAIDIDEWAYRNALENIQLNGIHNIRVEQGDSSLLDNEKPYDIILANINRNILLQDIPTYTAVLKKGGRLVLSGFYNVDIDVLRSKAEEMELTLQDISTKGEWVAVSFCLE